MIKAALTGTIGSGKTTALKGFKKCGAAVASSDAWVHEELAENVSLRRSLARAFGASVVKRGRVDRRRLADVVFKDKKKVRLLNSLIHPLVKRRLFAFFRANRRRKLVVVEVPLLFEAKFDRFFDVTIGVATDPRLKQRRLRRRGRASASDIQRRTRCQLSDEAKISRCDFVIDNNRSQSQTFDQINKLTEVILWKS